MRLRLMALAAAAGACVTLCAQAPARADVIYDFNGTSSVTPPYGGPYYLTISLDIADAAVQKGSFDLSGTGFSAGPVASMPPDFNGDVADFISLSSSTLLGTITPAYFPQLQTFNLALTFDPATGAVTSSNFVAQSEQIGDASISGTGATATGRVASDDPRLVPCLQNSYCPVSGSWTQSNAPSPVPEPAAFAVLGTGLIGLAGLRRRAA